MDGREGYLTEYGHWNDEGLKKPDNLRYPAKPSWYDMYGVEIKEYI